MIEPFGVDADEAYTRGVPITTIAMCVGIFGYLAIQRLTTAAILEIATLFLIIIGIVVGFILCSYFVGVIATLFTRSLNR